jgi:uncharacterized protein (DUF2336 family)
MTDSLSKDDVARLLTDPSADTRADIAAKVAHQIEVPSLSAAERAIAEDIVRVLSRDAAVRVRQALAEQLKQSRRLPHDVAVSLANDVDVVSLPILTHSVVLTDEDLLEVIRCSGAAKQSAIASREAISARVAAAIVEKDQVAAVATLVANDGADLDEPVLQQVLDRYGDTGAINEPIAARAELPVTVIERMVVAASASLRDILAKRSDLPSHLVSDLVLNTRERATVSLLSPTSPRAEALKLVQHLQRSKRLTPSLIVRALCLGDLPFVEAAFAVLADIPTHNARRLIHDNGQLGFKALYERCRLPAQLFDLFHVALKVARDTDFDGGENDRERHRRRTLERILTQYDELGAEDLDYLLGKLRADAVEAA